MFKKPSIARILSLFLAFALAIPSFSGTTILGSSGGDEGGEKRQHQSGDGFSKEPTSKKKKARKKKQERVYHFRDSQGANQELISLRNPYQGFNPNRGTGGMGSGLYVLLEQHYQFDPTLGATLYEIEPPWGNNPLILQTAQQVQNLHVLARELLRYFIINNMQEGDLFARDDTTTWQRFVNIDTDEEDWEDELDEEIGAQLQLVRNAFDGLFPDRIDDFGDILEGAQGAFLDRAHHALDPTRNGVVHQPVNHFLQVMGYTAVRNTARDDFSWGSVIFNVAAALQAAIILAQPNLQLGSK